MRRGMLDALGTLPVFEPVSFAPIMQEQGSKSRLRGLEAVKANILAAKTVARTLRSSLGPKGMDKMLQSPDGDVTISEHHMHTPGLSSCSACSALKCTAAMILLT